MAARHRAVHHQREIQEVHPMEAGQAALHRAAVQAVAPEIHNQIIGKSYYLCL